MRDLPLPISAFPTVKIPAEYVHFARPVRARKADTAIDARFTRRAVSVDIDQHIENDMPGAFEIGCVLRRDSIQEEAGRYVPGAVVDVSVGMKRRLHGGHVHPIS